MILNDGDVVSYHKLPNSYPKLGRPIPYILCRTDGVL